MITGRLTEHSETCKGLHIAQPGSFLHETTQKAHPLEGLGSFHLKEKKVSQELDAFNLRNTVKLGVVVHEASLGIVRTCLKKENKRKKKRGPGCSSVLSGFNPQDHYQKPTHMKPNSTNK